VTTGITIRRVCVTLLLALALLVVPFSAGHATAAPSASTPGPSATSTAEKQKLAKTRFVLNAGLAAGATYQWIVKPAKAGKFKKGAHGRKITFLKAGLAGAFAYNRLKAASQNAKGDPTLSKLMAPVTAGINSLKALPAKLRNGDNPDAAVKSYDDVINKVKEAGKNAGAEVKEKVPSLSDLKSGAGSGP
jgi:hypothetical protein